MATVSTHRRFRQSAIAGIAAAVTPVVGIAAAAPVRAAPAPAAAAQAAGQPVKQAQIVGPYPVPGVVQQVGPYLVGASPNFIGVIPSAGVCRWDFGVFESPTGIVYSALTCWGPFGPTYALVGTNPAIGCNDFRVCEFLGASSLVWLP